MTKFYEVAHYGGYFDVSTSDVLFRLRKALWPFCAKNKLIEDDKYDCYGPIWIMATLIVEIAIIGFVINQIDVEKMIYEIKHGHAPGNYLELFSL